MRLGYYMTGTTLRDSTVSYWIGFLDILDLESLPHYTNPEVDSQVIIAYLDGEGIEKSQAHQKDQ